MVLSKHFLVAILLICALVIFPVLVQAHLQKGFISVDCGVSDLSSYTDEISGLFYVSDTNFTEAGENRVISPSYEAQNIERQFRNVRSFPQGNRSCYTLNPSKEEGPKYLIRARFMYGNYDDKEAVPSFDLYLGADLWDTVEIENATTITTKEIIHIPSLDQVHVCLVNKGQGTPFISVLELRPVDSHIYVHDETGSSILLYEHSDFSSATGQVMRYHDDEFDRLWSPLVDDVWKPFLSTSLSNEQNIEINDYQIPSTVMSTAYTQNRGTSSLNLRRENLNSNSSYLFYMYFAELEILQKNESREFKIYINGDLWSETCAPSYLKTTTLSSRKAIKTDNEGTIDIWFNSTNTSTRPPLINAWDMYVPKELFRQETNQKDVEAISNIKSAYELKRISWQGDPCAPKAYMWDGLDCSYNANDPPRIVSLNLSSGGLKGELVPSIGNLEMLEHLDLSNNNLNGTIPEFLAQLSSLKILKLQGNNFTGPIPDALSERTKKGLSLSIDTNPSTTTSCSSESCGKKKHFVVPVVASLAGVLFVFLTTVVVLWSLKRRRQQKASDSKADVVNEESNEVDGIFVTKKQQFTYSEIQIITNNFERVLGEGGFGKVYHGYLDGKNVAVKMLSALSVQGHRQFHAELKLLLRVHHKNLTTLVGYCNDESNIGLIYEYMAMGNLRSHLSGSNQNILAWEDRLRIAIDAAQGLEYLHNGCKPPIVHRDVKSTNILLNEKFQAKLGDFGLSKIFPLESVTGTTDNGISTSIAGTPGYLDPEYYVSNWLNEKSDVYSFGVVLLEIVTARPALVKTEGNNHIIQWVTSMLAKGDVRSILDPKLEGGNFDINTVWKVIEIAMACVSTSSTKRPNMSLVAMELKECLTTNLTPKVGHEDAEISKDSDEMISQNMISQDMSPQAR
ncbi:Mitogen-activated protein kinase kinase kinase [Trema orientale]|uniref:non-specific serine/threonine protein kinase n=1 Tax=Trema orientale TaxID=63057 RepID=A0A2P5EFG9_TREOI|nr:Mitogen-activated protein kinase kinase kinase [Trema orientale]